ncbi:MAG: DUF2304 family protein [Candidatus Woesearchaeota archaeon]|nr:DUF2304 family protein [Candidatus Woesearchaeota archaeon]
MISILQIIVTLFIVFALSRAIFRFRDKQINLLELVFWCLLWIAAGVVLFIPQATNPIARLLNVGRGIDVPVYLSIVLLFYLVFRLYVKLDSINQNITKIVREVAIKKKK